VTNLRRERTPDREATRGQSLVEFSMVVTVMLLLLLGMLEFGFIFDQHLTLEYSSREGARVGAAMANGSTTYPCATVDDHVIAAVQRVMTSPGSRVTPSRVTEIRIYKATSTGAQSGTLANTWVYQAAGGPTVDGKALDFKNVTTNWSACGRSNTTSAPDSLGVRVSYSYVPVTPLSAVMSFFGGGGGGPATIPITDKTVMALNPGN
jgi:Flp pilus assembly protein TadG